jgi:hypothetical protein
MPRGPSPAIRGKQRRGPRRRKVLPRLTEDGATRIAKRIIAQSDAQPRRLKDDFATWLRDAWQAEGRGVDLSARDRSRVSHALRRLSKARGETRRLRSLLDLTTSVASAFSMLPLNIGVLMAEHRDRFSDEDATKLETIGRLVAELRDRDERALFDEELDQREGVGYEDATWGILALPNAPESSERDLEIYHCLREDHGCSARDASWALGRSDAWARMMKPRQLPNMLKYRDKVLREFESWAAEQGIDLHPEAARLDVTVDDAAAVRAYAAPAAASHGGGAAAAPSPPSDSVTEHPDD